MRWGTVTAAQTEGEWFEDYVRLALVTPAPALPPKRQHIGATQADWFTCEPGIAFIRTTGGSTDDRSLAERIVRTQLAGHGIRQAQFDIDPDEDFRKTATWDDIMAKAKRLIQAGNVQVLRNGYENVVGQVQGDHGNYQTEIMRQDPNSRVITQWSCECPWDQYAFQRTRQWKKYEARPCAHVLATFWVSQGTPLDEDVHPANQTSPMGQGQMNLFAPPGGGPSAPAPAPFAAPGGAPQGQQLPLPGMFPGTATGTPPVGGPDVIPPFPMEQMGPQVNPASVPGLKQPSPTNPVQYPGGTFSAVQGGWELDTITAVAAQPAGFINGNMVSTNHDDWGTWQGRSEEDGAGAPAKIPAGSSGEVLGQDPTTGMVNVLFMNPATGVNEHGRMEPWGATAWFFPSELALRPDIKRPGPAIKRK